MEEFFSLFREFEVFAFAKKATQTFEQNEAQTNVSQGQNGGSFFSPQSPCNASLYDLFFPPGRCATLRYADTPLAFAVCALLTPAASAEPIQIR